MQGVGWADYSGVVFSLPRTPEEDYAPDSLSQISGLMGSGCSPPALKPW